MPLQIFSGVCEPIRIVGVEPKSAITERAKQTATASELQFFLHFPNSVGFPRLAIRPKQSTNIHRFGHPFLPQLVRNNPTFLPPVIVINREPLRALLLRATTDSAATALLFETGVIPIQPDTVFLAIVSISFLFFSLGHIISFRASVSSPFSVLL